MNIAEEHSSAAKTSGEPESAPNIEPLSYAKELRALGQAIEKLNFSSVDLELESGVYIVRGKITATKAAQLSFSRFVRDLIFGVTAASVEENSTGKTDLRFSPEQIVELESEGRARRKESDKVPDPYSLSQILRGAGSYLDRRYKTSLARITIKDRWVTLRYRTAEGQLEQAKQDIEFFYNYWVKMYLHRRNRPDLKPPPDPSLIVTWDAVKKKLIVKLTRFFIPT